MTGAELAELTGLSEATVSRLASGERKPSLETMAKVEGVLGWSVSRQTALYLEGADAYANEFSERLGRRGSSRVEG